MALASDRQGNWKLLRLIPGCLQPLIPLIHSPLAIYFIVAREREISCANLARDRLEDIRAAVDQSEPVSVDEVSWLRQRKWDGIDWSLIGL